VFACGSIRPDDNRLCQFFVDAVHLDEGFGAGLLDGVNAVAKVFEQSLALFGANTGNNLRIARPMALPLACPHGWHHFLSPG
jgi:hypothetical protein